MKNDEAWKRKTKQRDLDVERTLRSQLRRANELLAEANAVNADMLTALVWAEAALAPFSKEPAEKSGINLIRAAIRRAKGEG